MKGVTLSKQGSYVLVTLLTKFSPNLQVLNLSRTNLGFETMKSIRDLLSNEKCGLKSLILSGNSLSDVIFCELCLGISQNFSLRALDVSSNRLSPVSMKIFNSIVKYSRILEEVDLSENSFIGNEGFRLLSKTLGRNQCLQIFKVRSIGINDEVAELL
mmetsp:Transcript_8475/g.6317  ORF Transcript_8475/g.6317 Transcript_8475/m.6317 type:complete len:158 (+) Transcript_8475:791-1264(+)